MRFQALCPLQIPGYDDVGLLLSFPSYFFVKYCILPMQLLHLTDSAAFGLWLRQVLLDYSAAYRGVLLKIGSV